MANTESMMNEDLKTPTHVESPVDEYDGHKSEGREFVKETTDRQLMARSMRCMTSTSASATTRSRP
jgi:hypothetical protein